MVIELQKTIKYKRRFVPDRRDHIVALKNLVQAGIFTNYVLYEGKNEVRIAGNELAKISVSKELVSFKGISKSYSEPASEPFKQVEKMLASLPIENWTAYGYVAFDMARFYSSYSKSIQQDSLYFLIPEIELIFTNEGVCIRSTKSIEQIQDILLLDEQLPNYLPDNLIIDFSGRENYQQQIVTLIEAIQKTELQKAIISRSQAIAGDLDVLGTYVVGARANNSARSYCLNIGDVRAVGFSPETLLEVYEDGFIVTNPLAGTRPRSQSLEEDNRLSHELFTDAKEVKEHALSIWLAQSEIASFCLPGTIQVFNFMEVKKYRCVQHLSSRVGGQLQPGKTLWDALKVLFPGITVSGIDKQQALKWIDRLEDEPRGIYAGGIGWVDSSGTGDLAIAIRSVYQYGDRIYLNAGAGIVAESIPEKEYIESVNKMNTMLTNLVLKSRF
ncbi:chorismate-binding protein [Chroococcidiopsis sp. FACHB-1243]|uniref:anthranilate synthase component I family protein n=1 Tax=Chroococcidiopsis sp. [FACHB-1243] TaxID=2692781 RepID=UPI00177E5B55|nr:chorismate-binding protein [Chroococcidiopsis sp. [FACHB-1243]]MBD2309021.1 chorismate-binding protein [Chroococcidiopsis sp. [FACHB-1243]]